MTIREALQHARNLLSNTSTSPDLDAELLCAYACGISRSAVLARESEVLPEQTAQVFAMVAQQRLDGMPIAYIRGEQEFYGRSFIVNRSVLIPRPETELLVDTVKQWVSERMTREDQDSTAAFTQSSLRVLDIGTGSGCIAITLAIELPGLFGVTTKRNGPHVVAVATDIDPEAIAVAQQNVSHLGADVEFRRGDCCDACVAGEQFDVIVSNPPYVPLERIAAATPEAMGLRYEPTHALTPLTGPHTSIVERIITQAPQWLAVGGLLAVEIGEDMGEQALSWAHNAFPDRAIEIQKEWSGADRLLVVR